RQRQYRSGRRQRATSQHATVATGIGGHRNQRDSNLAAMKTSRTTRRQRAFTVLELLVLLATLAVLAALLLPALLPSKRYHGPNLVNNPKQIGLLLRIWSGDNNDRFPMAVPTSEGGTMGFPAGTNVFEHFRAMSNELNTPKILVCPDDKKRTAATNFL